MLRAAVILALLGLVVATPTLVRSPEEVQAFRDYLESTKTSKNDDFAARVNAAPEANAEALSGKFDGDIVLDDFMIDNMVQEYAGGRNAYTWPNTKWPGNTVVWEFGQGEFGAQQQAAIQAAIRDIEAHTCVRFRYREARDTAYVRVTGAPDGCYAHVGYWASRGIHTLNLARSVVGWGCLRHTVIVHEWMHILGFMHMQSTHDRDNYVRIVPANIIPGTEFNFEAYGRDLVDNLGVAYDYLSCMHYDAYSFSVNGRATIVAIRPHAGVMGQREYVTREDWLRINRHYNCPGAWN